MDQVDLIASGYEWTCSGCKTFNTVIEVAEVVRCVKCRRKYEVSSVEHAYK